MNNTGSAAGRSHEARPPCCASLCPIVVLALGVAIWEAAVRHREHSAAYVLPSPGLILQTLIGDWALLFPIAFWLRSRRQSRDSAGGSRRRRLAVLVQSVALVEYSFYPYAVILQVTPIVAVAPLLLIYLPQPLAVLACAWIVAFFPVLANTTLGLNSVDRNLVDLFALYGRLARPGFVESEAACGAALYPGGLRIAGGCR